MSICPKNKSSKARRDKRRANWKLSLPGMVKCPKCGEYVEVFVLMGGKAGQTGTLKSDEICACGHILPAGSFESDYEK